jgi:hypothetical protein
LHSEEVTYGEIRDEALQEAGILDTALKLCQFLKLLLVEIL